MKKKPNIVFINPDQWRGDVLGHLGNPAAKTPNLDRVVRENGVSFSRAFTQNPICTPSRCGFMTGWYPHVKGHRSLLHMLHIERQEPVLLKILKDAGYHIWWGGKNDLVPGQHSVAPFCDRRFQASSEDYKRWGTIPAREAQNEESAWRGKPGDPSYYSFLKGKLDKQDQEVYCDSDWANVYGARDFIKDYDSQDPFVLYLALDFPHPPYGVEEPWHSMIDRNALPPRIKGPGKGKPAMFDALRERFNLGSWSEEQWNELRAVYYGMCARVDHQYGLIVEALKARGLYEDTAIFFFADHGDFTGNFELVEKAMNVFDDSLCRVPFIVKPPADYPVSPGVRDSLIELVDFPATVFHMTGISPGYHHFGKSLVPLFEGPGDHRDAVFCEGGRLTEEWREPGEEHQTHLVPTGLYWPRVGLESMNDKPYHGKAAMCRTEKYKYVYRNLECDELYDLETDPQEKINRIDDPAYREVHLDLKERLLKWFVETCDVLPFEEDAR